MKRLGRLGSKWWALFFPENSLFYLRKASRLVCETTHQYEMAEYAIVPIQEYTEMFQLIV